MEDKHFNPPPQPVAKSSGGWVIAMVILAVLGMGMLTCILACGVPAYFAAKETALKIESKNNLKQIGLALWSYESLRGTFPPAYIADEDGRPMTSWRTLILPYLEYQGAYDQYDATKPWDDPANASLSEIDIPIFQSPRDTSNRLPGKTNYVVVTGENTAMPGENATSMDDIRDGTTSTILVVEILNSDITWSEPRDLHIDTFQRLGVSGLKETPNIMPRSALVVFADGSVHELPPDMTRQTLQLLMQCNDGEVVPMW